MLVMWIAHVVLLWCALDIIKVRTTASSHRSLLAPLLQRVALVRLRVHLPCRSEV